VWTIHNVSFDDGGAIANGTFTIDQFGFFTNGSISITTTAGSTLPGFTYPDPSVASEVLNGGMTTLFFTSALPAFGGGLQLTFLNPLTTPGIDPVVGGAGGPSWECIGFSCPAGTTRYVELQSGSFGFVSAAPLPSTWLMLGSALLGLGWLVRRGTKASASAALAPV
jgi:hypothetical protein